jgi:predicted aldo/keto reductase-like oxidoreductase
MLYRPLGNTDIQVSLITLGTMTFGEQNTEAEAHAQLDMAVEYGVNLIDAAEMYPVPPKPETQGLTEQYIGTWLKKSGNREKVLVATKAAGPSLKNIQVSYIRGGKTRHNRENLESAVNTSLQRLQTDHIGPIARPIILANWVISMWQMNRRFRLRKHYSRSMNWSNQEKFVTSAYPTKHRGASVSL